MVVRHRSMQREGALLGFTDAFVYFIAISDIELYSSYNMFQYLPLKSCVIRVMCCEVVT
jgi:hypothetical protein